MGKRSENPMHFEKSLEQLEAIVKRLEEDAVPLDQALKLFSEGQGLARSCESQLRAAENQIRKLMETPEGEIVEEELEPGETRATGGADEDAAPELAAGSGATLNGSAAANDDAAPARPSNDLPF